MQAVPATEDFKRIVALPRRKPTGSAKLAGALTELLRKDGGTMVLRELQALALHDIGVCGGAYLPLDLGEGKTLISLLAAYVLDARRPLLLLPAQMIRETADKLQALNPHWLIPNNIRMMSYQMLGLVQSARDLDVYAPDLIICDESHKLKNRDAAVTRRVERYMAAHPETKLVAMTGTIMRKSVRDFAHIIRWALKDGAPVPLKDNEVDEWALALDEKIENEFQRVQPGALLQLVDTDDHTHLDPIVAARRAFRQRLRETPGVVASAPTGAEVEVDLVIRALRYDVSPEIERHYETLRNLKQLPDGRELWEASEVWQHARELALGFYAIWDPPGPDDWRAARKAWFQFVRGVLGRSRTWDSPKHIAQACDAGKLDSTALNAWRKIQPSFTPNSVPVWCDDSALKVAAKWMKHPGIVWVEHIPFGERLSQMTGAKYYGADGLAPDGEFILNGDPRKAIIASRPANCEGRNLQDQWHRNLITTMPEGWDIAHQLIGRTHRSGQKKDVEVDVFLGCAEHARAWVQANSSAQTTRDAVGSQSKLLLADIEWPEAEEIASWSGARWQRNLLGTTNHG